MSRPEPHTCIDAPELLGAPERARDALATALLWGIYVYLWLPLLSLAAWWLGFEFAYDVMVRAGGAASLTAVLIRYSIAVGVIFAIVTLWSFSNRIRFRNSNRRRVVSSVSDEALAAAFEIEPAAIARLRSERRIIAAFDARGRPLFAQAPAASSTSSGGPTR